MDTHGEGFYGPQDRDGVADADGEIPGYGFALASRHQQDQSNTAVARDKTTRDLSLGSKKPLTPTIGSDYIAQPWHT